MTRWGIVLWLAIGCTQSVEAPQKSLDTERHSGDAAHQALRDEARLILEEHCGSCHLPDYPTTIGAALAVFDLSQEEWAATMSEEQLHDASNRLGEDLAPGGPDGTPLNVPEADRTLFEQYVASELARRSRE